MMRLITCAQVSLWSPHLDAQRTKFLACASGKGIRRDFGGGIAVTLRARLR